MIAQKLFRKYSNRRLYDVEKACYVSLNEVRDAVLTAQSIKVEDSKTGEDITDHILLQIITKQNADKKNQAITTQTLLNLIRLYENPAAAMASQYLEQFLHILQSAPQSMPPSMMFSDMADQSKMAQEQMQHFWANWLSAFTPPNDKN